MVSHATFIQLAEGLGFWWKCLSGMKTSTEKTANGAALTAIKNRRLPRRDRERSDQDARRGFVTASKKRAPKLMMPMIVRTPSTAPSKMNGGKILVAAVVSGGM